MTLKHSLLKLRESSDKLSAQSNRLPNEFRPFVELVNAQTAVIEDFLEFERKVKFTRRQKIRTGCTQGNVSRNGSRPAALDEHNTTYETCYFMSGAVPPTVLGDPVDNRKLSPTDRSGLGVMQKEQAQDISSGTQFPTENREQATYVTSPSSKARPHIAFLKSNTSEAKTPRATPGKLNNLVLDESIRERPDQTMKTPTVPGSFPLTPRLPIISEVSTPNTHGPYDLQQEAVDSERARSSMSSRSSKTVRPARRKVHQEGEGDEKQQASSSPDEICEAHVQQALSTLITSMKERKKIPLGDLQGSFSLYSTMFRRYSGSVSLADKILEGDGASYQNLSIFSSAADWSTVLPNVPSPTSDQIAMELIIHPNCHMIGLPFKPPRNADWKWHSVDVVVFNNDTDGTNESTRRSRVDMMFPGNGFIKIKIRLSQVLGQKRDTTEPDRFIEFSGIWQNNGRRTHHLMPKIKRADDEEHDEQEPGHTRATSGAAQRQSRPPAGVDSQRTVSLSTSDIIHDLGLEILGLQLRMMEEEADEPASPSQAHEDRSSAAAEQQGGHDNPEAADTSSSHRVSPRSAATIKRSRSQESDVLPAGDIWSPVSPF